MAPDPDAGIYLEAERNPGDRGTLHRLTLLRALPTLNGTGPP
jgi:hypothetical protein